MELPEFIKELNKNKKATKVTTLTRAKAFNLKRFWSGSFGVDRIAGGGFAYRRIQLLYGAKSCIEGDSFLWYELWKDGKRVNSKGGTISRLYERFTGDISEGVKQGRHLQDNDVTFYVKSVDSVGRVLRNEVLEVVKTGVKECYRVLLSTGESLVSTLEHRYLTSEGYKPLKDLNCGDMLYVNTNNRKKHTKRKRLQRPEVYVKYHPILSTKLVRDHYGGVEKEYVYHRGKKSRMMYEAFLNKMSYEEYLKFLNTRSKEEISSLEFLPKNVHVHHRDENFLNNDISNLELVDPTKHGRIHMQDKKRIDNIRAIIEESSIIEITPVGKRETYDLKCAYPYNNYIANNIVVHNSGKNALLNQTTAYLQRQCRVCHGIDPDFIDSANRPKDYWTFVMYNILGYHICKCKICLPKSVFILDYERALAIEEPRDVKIKLLTNKKTKEDVDELDYTDALARIQELKAKEIMSDADRELMKKDEKFLKEISVTEKVIHQIAVTDYLKKCGVLPDKLLVADPEDTEEGIEMVRDAIKSKEVDAIIWDSLQAAIPRFVMDRDSDQATMGVEAKQNGLLMRHVCSAFAARDLTDETEAYKPSLFITSQIRSPIGGFYKAPDTYSGGNAVQHHISLALELKRIKFLRENGTEAAFEDDFYGQSIRLRAEKNKLSAPGDIFTYDYYFRESDTFPIGIDGVGELLHIAVKLGIVNQIGSWYSIDQQKFQGITKLKDYCRNNHKIVRDIYAKVASA